MTHTLDSLLRSGANEAQVIDSKPQVAKVHARNQSRRSCIAIEAISD